MAETIPLPPSVSNVDDIINEFRKTLETKINELGKNFITRTSDRNVLFTNSSPLNCHGSIIPQSEPVASMQYNFKSGANELIEKSIYKGCNDRIALVEDVVTRGNNLVPLKYNDFIKGKRQFELNDNERYRLYRVSNAENEEIFKVLIEKKENSKLVDFYILGQIFLRMNYDFKETSTRLTLTYFGYKASYITKYSSWELNNTVAPFSHAVFVTNSKFNQPSYFDIDNGVISQAEYLSKFDKRVLSGAISTIRNIFEYHNFYFPSTKIIQTGLVNEYFKEELRILYNRILNNTETNLVKRQVLDYIDAAENGTILDNRPKQ
ncbi:MAG: hypothetical protein EHM20_15625 [Alphaproteobacteria bacterium]|nr:MAG: hypothetical protein EHM20_15625 [Alphaproteobacteria bacterium]